MPHWFVYLVIGAPVIYAVSRDDLRVPGRRHRGRIRIRHADPRARRGTIAPSDISDISGGLIALQTAGTVGLAFLFVMLPLRARRVGLLTPFMGILGAISGALVVFQLAAVSAVVQAFWLGALGALFLGRWPGGRGPAWETGEAEPWPTAAQRRAELAGEAPVADAPPTGARTRAARRSPSRCRSGRASRKRRKKRKR